MGLLLDQAPLCFQHSAIYSTLTFVQFPLNSKINPPVEFSVSYQARLETLREFGKDPQQVSVVYNCALKKNSLETKQKHKSMPWAAFCSKSSSSSCLQLAEWFCFTVTSCTGKGKFRQWAFWSYQSTLRIDLTSLASVLSSLDVSVSTIKEFQNCFWTLFGSNISHLFPSYSNNSIEVEDLLLFLDE